MLFLLSVMSMLTFKPNWVTPYSTQTPLTFQSLASLISSPQRSPESDSLVSSSSPLSIPQHTYLSVSLFYSRSDLLPLFLGISEHTFLGLGLNPLLVLISTKSSHLTSSNVCSIYWILADRQYRDGRVFSCDTLPGHSTVRVPNTLAKRNTVPSVRPSHG